MQIIQIEKGIDAKEQLGSQINLLYQRSKQMKSELQDYWWTYHAFFDGKQYVSFKHGRPNEPKAPSWRVRAINNYIKPIVSTVASKLTQSRPAFIVRPTGSEDDQRQKARASEYLLDYLYRQMRMQTVTHDVVWWAALTGSGFFNCYWDHQAGKTFQVGDGLSVTGFPRVEAWSPFDIYPDWEASHLHDAKWVVLAHVLSGPAVDLRWPGIINKLDVKRQNNTTTYASDDDTIRKSDLRGYVSDAGDEKVYKVLEYQERPSDDHPAGRRVIVSEGVVLEETHLPGRRFSITQVKIGEMAGRFWGTGVVQGLIPIQRELNRTISQILEMRNLSTNPPWIAAAGSISKSGIKNRPDHIVFYNANVGPPPQRVPPVPIPNSLYELADTLKNNMYDISGVHEISQGRGPAGVISGRALGVLADQDAVKLSAAARSLEEAFSNLGAGILEMWRENMEAEITVSVVSESHRSEAIRFHRDHIDSTDVEVQTGSLLPKFASYEREISLQLLQLGGFGPIEDPETLVKFRKAFGSMGLREFIDDDSPERNYQRQENMMMMNSENHEFIKVGWWHNHAVHISELLTFMKSPEYRELEPETQHFYELHLAEHYRQMQIQMQGLPAYVQAYGQDPQQVMAAQQQAGAMGGQPPQLGPPGIGPPEGMVQPMPGELPYGEENTAGQLPGMVGGGTPILNQAVGPRGPGFNPAEERGFFE